MPYTRPIRRFYLTPPGVPIFLVSVVAVLAVLAAYGHMSIFNASYGVLLAGILFRAFERTHNGKLSCFRTGSSTCFTRSMASARARRARVACGMITSSM
jgi:hypothetical protein